MAPKSIQVVQGQIVVSTRGRELVDITAPLVAFAASSGLNCGVITVFVQHTSASLLITENADPDVHRDLETLFRRLAPDGDPAFQHRAEGPDDMAAHARSVLTATSLSIPLVHGRLGLGTW
ncbi:MAG: secondary thiamine-phosphate synthase enzyme YjbQ [Pigmentiphaga sp.]